MKKDNKKKYIFLLALLTIAISVLVCLCICRSRTDTQPVSSGIRWDGNNITVARDKNEKYITIPCFTDLSFRANQTAQIVNIYNPEKNECIMDFSIVLSDETVIWESDNTLPGYGFHDIELTKPLSSGVYEARLITRCFTYVRAFDENGNQFTTDNSLIEMFTTSNQHYTVNTEVQSTDGAKAGMYTGYMSFEFEIIDM